MISLHSMHNTLCLFSLDTFHFTLARNVQSCVVSLLLGIELHVRWFTMLWSLLRKRYTIPRNQTNVWTFVVTVSVSLLSLLQSLKAYHILACGAHWSTVVDNTFPTRHQTSWCIITKPRDQALAQCGEVCFDSILNLDLCSRWHSHRLIYANKICVKPLLLKRHSLFVANIGALCDWVLKALGV